MGVERKYGAVDILHGVERYHCIVVVLLTVCDDGVALELQRVGITTVTLVSIGEVLKCPAIL